MRLARDFWTSKTTWASFTGILSTILAALQHKIDPFHALIVAIGMLHLPFLRDSWVKKAEDILAALEGIAQGKGADGGEVNP